MLNRSVLPRLSINRSISERQVLPNGSSRESVRNKQYPEEKLQLSMFSLLRDKRKERPITRAIFKHCLQYVQDGNDRNALIELVLLPITFWIPLLYCKCYCRNKKLCALSRRESRREGGERKGGEGWGWGHTIVYLYARDHNLAENRISINSLISFPRNTILRKRYLLLIIE